MHRLRILLVENDALVRSLLAESLENAGFEATVAGTGREALEFAGSQSFDLAVLDHGLPDCSGTKLAETLRRTWQIPFVFLTAKTDDATVAQAAEIGALEHERQRLASELHDGLGQELTAASLMAAAIERNSMRGVPLAIPDLAALRQTLEQAQRYCRDLSHREYAPAVRGSALGDSLRSLTSREGALTGMECIYEGPTGATPTVPDIVSHHLYRVAQEAICNAIRHSGGSRVTVQLHIEARMATMSIRDNGRGRSTINCADGCGIGCLTMRNRALSMGGNIIVRDAMPSGTEVVIEVPL
ncbi:MAG: response regulator [Steroidobacteraceae bacterium]